MKIKIPMTEKYFEILSTYIGMVTWFVILIAAKISHVATRKKLTRGQLIANILYALIGGIGAYFGTISFQYNFRVIAVAVGVLAGDVIVEWIPTNFKGLLDTFGEVVKKWLSKKK